MIYVAVFFLAFFGDIGWTMYFLEVEKDHAIRAAAWSSFIVAMGGISTFEYVKDPLIIIPAVLGSFAGVWVTMRWSKIKFEWHQFWGSST